jgi:Flp pilus assembly protein TadG
MIRHREEEGAVAVIVALLLVVFMAAVALTVDVGGLYLRRRALVNGSDAAALGAARTCARGVGNDSRFGSPEEAADFEVQANAPITDAEVDPITNITYPPAGGCAAPTQYGHLTVQYTSQQALYFAPVLGFNHESPVTTTATASWGLGSNNPIPIVLTSAVSTGACTIPPLAFPTAGSTCSFWYDNDRLGGGNFAFLSLNAAGWDVPQNSQCPASQAGGSSNLKNWINGSLPASVALNWTDPTYVCTETGIRGVQNASLNCPNPGNQGNQSSVWEALECLAVVHAVRDFPINWEGCGNPIAPCPPVAGAPSQGTVYTGSPGNPTIDKYDIIGFASMKVMDVVTPQEAQGQTTTTQQPWDTANYAYDASGITLNTILPAGSIVDYMWTGTHQQGQQTVQVGGRCTFTTNQDTPAGPYTWQAFGGNGNGCPANGDSLNAGQPNPLSITYPVTTTTYTPCGPPPPGNSSAMCVILEYQHSTLDADFPPGTDNNTIIRLCDLAFDTCLDQ